MHEDSIFLTLTYDDEHLPVDGGLDHTHWQLFAKKARRRFGPFRFFMCGEYGETNKRPHFHAICLGIRVGDALRANGVLSARPLWQSPTIDQCWGRGRAVFGAVSYESARYCAAYVVKKRGADSDDYQRVRWDTGEIVQVRPEYAKMSLRPGIGAEWLRRYWPEVYASGHKGVHVGSKKQPPPRYFTEKMKEWLPEVAEAHQMSLQADIRPKTRAQLEAREAIAKSRSQLFRRSDNAI